MPLDDPGALEIVSEHNLQRFGVHPYLLGVRPTIPGRPMLGIQHVNGKCNDLCNYVDFS
jgi:hypothetical protein